MNSMIAAMTIAVSPVPVVLDELDVGAELRDLGRERLDVLAVGVLLEGLELRPDVVDHLLLRVEFALVDVELEGADRSISCGETAGRSALAISGAHCRGHGGVGGSKLLALLLDHREVGLHMELVLGLDALQIRGMLLEVRGEVAELPA